MIFDCKRLTSSIKLTYLLNNQDNYQKFSETFFIDENFYDIKPNLMKLSLKYKIIDDFFIITTYRTHYSFFNTL